MTGKDVDDRLKNAIKDVEELKWKKPEKLQHINDAVRMTASSRSDALMDTDGSIITITPITDLTANDTISIADKWLSAVVQYAASLCFQDEGGDKQDFSRAGFHLNNFTTFVNTL